ncbi:unnamed protein product [Fraxinus pennsylvanica]|uniref:Uncharacterized protein n=1 Tax=Fraxinus pennsylvanica TaxID=56036 RepID=A0AAD2E3M6_9LAMI|nr:unnamed protein product [Fraxinus pennsylvanica]
MLGLINIESYSLSGSLSVALTSRQSQLRYPELIKLMLRPARLDIEMSAMLKEQLVKVFSSMKSCRQLDEGMLFNMNRNLMLFSSFSSGDFPSGLISLLLLVQGLRDQDLLLHRRSGYCVASVDEINGTSSIVSNTTYRRILQSCSFSNLLVFLLTGRYRSLVYGSPNMSRAVSFEYMNCQLVWNEYSEMLLLFLPRLTSSSVKCFLHPFSKDKSSNSVGNEALCPCSICQATPTTPFLALPCQHRCNEPMQRHKGSFHDVTQKE